MALFYKYPLKYWFVLVFAPPGNAKSLEQARLSEKVFLEYDRTERKYPMLPHRILMSNQHIRTDMAVARSLSGHYIYWRHPEEFRYCPRKENCWKFKNEGYEVVHDNHDVDLFVDEGAVLFPADGWSNTPSWLRDMWAQHRHVGIRILMLTQDYNGIDINARRMIWQSYLMKKVIGSRDPSPTLPPLSPWTLLNLIDPSKHVIWGVYTKQRFDPLIMKSDPLTMLTIQLNEKTAEDYKKLRLIGGAEVHLITWHKCTLYDTSQSQEHFEVIRELEHIEVACNHVGCGYVHKTHKIK